MSVPTTPPKSDSRRILAFDIIRGFFLVMILIDHIELYPSIFDLFTGRGRLFVSAAEGFFFMSGLLVGLVYKRRVDYGMPFIFKKMWRRALELYIASIFFTLLYTALAVYLNHPNIKDGLYSVIDWPHIISETMLMRYGFGWADFLDRFAILMFLAPFGFYLLTKGKWWLLALASLIAWKFSGNGFTLSWQIIFSLGMIVGFHWHQLTARWWNLTRATRGKIKASVVAVTAVSFAFSYGSVYILSLLNQKWNSLPAWGQTFTGDWNSANAFLWNYAQKWSMGPLRIVLFIFWFSLLFLLVHRYQHRLNRITAGVFELLGRNSLFVYIAHSLIVFAFRLYIPPNTPLWENFLITGAALALLIGITMAYRRYWPQAKTWLEELMGDRKPRLAWREEP